jgi:putative transposase
VDGSGNGYLKGVCDYVHLNPVRAGLLAPEQPLQRYAWSSYPAYLQEPASRPSWLRVDRLPGDWGIPFDSAAGREPFAKSLEARRRAEANGSSEPTGWCHGSEEFRQELLAQVEQMADRRDGGEEVRESALAKAQRIADEELLVLGWTLRDLEGRRKSDPQKVRIAARLRRETTMRLEWIAERLRMGAATHVATLLQRY